MGFVLSGSKNHQGQNRHSVVLDLPVAAAGGPAVGLPAGVLLAEAVLAQGVAHPGAVGPQVRPGAGVRAQAALQTSKNTF